MHDRESLGSKNKAIPAKTLGLLCSCPRQIMIMSTFYLRMSESSSEPGRHIIIANNLLWSSQKSKDSYQNMTTNTTQCVNIRINDIH